MQVFSVDGLNTNTIIEEVSKERTRRVRRRIETIAEDSLFKENPVQFIYDWKEKNPDIPMRIFVSYPSMDWSAGEKVEMSYSHYVFEGEDRACYCVRESLSSEVTAITSIAEKIIGHPRYVFSFVKWLKASSDGIIKQLHPDTHPEAVSLIQKKFKEIVEEKGVFTMFGSEKDFLVKVKCCEKKVVRKTAFDDGDELPAPEYPVRDVIARTAHDDLEYIRKMFFQLNVNFFHRLKHPDWEDEGLDY